MRIEGQLLGTHTTSEQFCGWSTAMPWDFGKGIWRNEALTSRMAIVKN